MRTSMDKEYDLFGFDKDFVERFHEVERRQLYYSCGGNTGLLRGRVTPEKLDHLGKDQILVLGCYKKEKQGFQGQSYGICTSEGLVVYYGDTKGIFKELLGIQIKGGRE